MSNFPSMKSIGKIPTRFDDIQKEIRIAKFKDYYELQEVPKIAEEKTYKLGSKVSEALRAMVLGDK